MAVHFAILDALRPRPPRDLPLLLATASAAAVMVSIAASHILLGAALVAMLAMRVEWRVPRQVRVPLALFILATLLSLAFSGDVRGGVPQVKKFYVFLMLAATYSCMRGAVHARRLVLAWGVLGAASATWGVVQFVVKRNEARALGRNFYEYYIAERITGFMSHWMTFSGELMIAGLMLGALLLWRDVRRWWLVPLLAIVAGLTLALTRGVWIATAGGALYLVARWRPKWVLAVPLLAGVGFVASPPEVKERFTSIYRPGRLDSNSHRLVTWRTGVEMIRAHPLLGVGPQQVGRRFDGFVPADIPRPLPDGYYGHLHNTYLHYAAERGVPAMAALLWLLLRVLIDFARARRAPALLQGAAAAVIAVMIEGLFELNLGDTEVLTMFLAAVGAGYAVLEGEHG